MNWIERMYEIKGKDLYSQNGEGLLLEYVYNHIEKINKTFVDIGGGDGFYLSNTRHLFNLGWTGLILDAGNGHFVRLDNIDDFTAPVVGNLPELVSIDTDGNDFWLIDYIMGAYEPSVICAEFNPAFTDSRTIKYNATHEWAGDDYYGFSFGAGKKLAKKHGYEIIFNVANMNLIMVRKDLIHVSVPPVTYEQVKFFKESNRTDWEWI